MLISYPRTWRADGGPASDGAPAFLEIEPPNNEIPRDPDPKFLLQVQIDPPEGSLAEVLRETRADLAREAKTEGLSWEERTGAIGALAACVFETRSSLIAPPGGETQTQRCDCINRDYLADWPTGGVLRIRAHVVYPRFWDAYIHTADAMVATVRLTPR